MVAGHAQLAGGLRRGQDPAVIGLALGDPGLQALGHIDIDLVAGGTAGGRRAVPIDQEAIGVIADIGTVVGDRDRALLDRGRAIEIAPRRRHGDRLVARLHAVAAEAGPGGPRAPALVHAVEMGAVAAVDCLEDEHGRQDAGIRRQALDLAEAQQYLGFAAGFRVAVDGRAIGQGGAAVAGQFDHLRLAEFDLAAVRPGEAGEAAGVVEIDPLEGEAAVLVHFFRIAGDGRAGAIGDDIIAVTEFEFDLAEVTVAAIGAELVIGQDLHHRLAVAVGADAGDFAGIVLAGADTGIMPVVDHEDLGIVLHQIIEQELPVLEVAAADIRAVVQGGNARALVGDIGVGRNDGGHALVSVDDVLRPGQGHFQVLFLQRDVEKRLVAHLDELIAGHAVRRRAAIPFRVLGPEPVLAEIFEVMGAEGLQRVLVGDRDLGLGIEIVIAGQDAVGNLAVQGGHGFVRQLVLLHRTGVIRHVAEMADENDVFAVDMIGDPLGLEVEQIRAAQRHHRQRTIGVILRIRQQDDRIFPGRIGQRLFRRGRGIGCVRQIVRDDVEHAAEIAGIAPAERAAQVINVAERGQQIGQLVVQAVVTPAEPQDIAGDETEHRHRRQIVQPAEQVVQQAAGAEQPARAQHQFGRWDRDDLAAPGADILDEGDKGVGAARRRQGLRHGRRRRGRRHGLGRAAGRQRGDQVLRRQQRAEGGKQRHGTPDSNRQSVSSLTPSRDRGFTVAVFHSAKALAG